MDIHVVIGEEVHVHVYIYIYIEHKAEVLNTTSSGDTDECIQPD